MDTPHLTCARASPAASVAPKHDFGKRVAFGWEGTLRRAGVMGFSPGLTERQPPRQMAWIGI